LQFRAKILKQHVIPPLAMGSIENGDIELFSGRTSHWERQKHNFMAFDRGCKVLPDFLLHHLARSEPTRRTPHSAGNLRQISKLTRARRPRQRIWQAKISEFSEALRIFGEFTIPGAPPITASFHYAADLANVSFPAYVADRIGPFLADGKARKARKQDAGARDRHADLATGRKHR
jgi:hypothetical protein